MKFNSVTDTFLELVKIDSLSGDESRVADYLIRRLAKIGLNFSPDTAGNLFCTSPGIGNPVLISAHMDTVEPGRGIKPMIKNGVIYSDGTTILGADNKAALAAIITTLETVDSKRRKSLEIIFSVREETNSGIKEFDFSRLKSSRGLIADRSAPIGEIVLAAPWIYNLAIRITGKSVHAGRPRHGINALTCTAEAISTCHWGQYDSQTTTNIGLISGGTAMNTVPEIINLTGEIRSFSQKSLDQVNEEIFKNFTNTSRRHKTKLNYDKNLYCPGYVHPKNDPSVTIVRNIMEKLGIKVSYEKVYGASDANSLNQAGIRVVTISDGCENAHTLHESVSVKNLEILEKIFTSYITA